MGLCFEFKGYSAAEACCTEAAQLYGRSFAFYGPDGCASGGEGPCLLPAGGGLPVPADTCYYEVGGPQRICEDAGGTWDG